MTESHYAPRPGDFDPLDAAPQAQTVCRPPLSRVQATWQRFRRNRSALISLGLILALLLFTLAGPWFWPVDPARQDLEQISRPPTLGKVALLVADDRPWHGSTAEPPPALPDATALPAPTGLTILEPATTRSVRLRWEPVAGAAGYAIYRSERPPADRADLGLPLGETWSGNEVGYEDRLQLEDRSYYYSVVTSDGFDESAAFAVVEVAVAQGITLADARSRGLVGPDAAIGDRVRLEAHPLGTDYLGRDLLARLIHGARVSLFIGLAAPLLFVLLGTLYGGLAGYMGGRIDRAMMRVVDFVIALPFLLFMILFKIAFGIGPGESGVLPMLVALVLLSWPSSARLVRGQVLQLRHEPYVQAARLQGAGAPYLIRSHMLPNILGVILVDLTFAIPSAIFIEAFLSFIGMGVVPPTPSWGSLCNEGMNTMLTHPHELFFPACLISTTVLAFNLLGDGLRDALDVRLTEGT
ncbi:MAG: ABC transporter permease [Oceanospirillaceae bacterium]|nr:ABC transporter permease [Oceanospirillaceae bacterium]